MNHSFYSKEELKEIGLHKVGENVLLSKKVSVYNAKNIELGSNVRIDDFCIISGNVAIGNNVHVAAYSALYGGEAGITVEDFANISSRVCLYAVSDDYSGATMTNPMIPDKYKDVQSKPIRIEKHVIIGTGSTVLPGVKLREGTALGAMSLCKTDTKPWGIYAGIPAKLVKERSRKLLELEKEYINECD